jgi:hypothetical protein
MNNTPNAQMGNSGMNPDSANITPQEVAAFYANALNAK